ncbi:30S ribosomal protein S17, chloroplastic [Trifolium pratense]|uniref:30S ribosomal protein S17, chloroplastic n=1 Tax=Trifolium pratense TaxID=57577 RepID=UPI001E6975DD|nr:30S ribosomal protein S17, chloroplastic [Trifolium pratense]
MWLLQLPSNLSSPFLTGNNVSGLNRLSKPTTTLSSAQAQAHFLPSIKAMKTMEGKVTCATNDKTVAVEVTRLQVHPKYKKRIRMKKKYQAHDPENVFKKGDLVQLQKIRPISKNKTFLAVAVPPRNRKSNNGGDANSSGELGIPLQSQQEEEVVVVEEEPQP